MWYTICGVRSRTRCGSAKSDQSINRLRGVGRGEKGKEGEKIGKSIGEKPETALSHDFTHPFHYRPLLWNILSWAMVINPWIPYTLYIVYVLYFMLYWCTITHSSDFPVFPLLVFFPHQPLINNMPLDSQQHWTPQTSQNPTALRCRWCRDSCGKEREASNKTYLRYLGTYSNRHLDESSIGIQPHPRIFISLCNGDIRRRSVSLLGVKSRKFHQSKLVQEEEVWSVQRLSPAWMSVHLLILYICLVSCTFLSYIKKIGVTQRLGR